MGLFALIQIADRPRHPRIRLNRVIAKNGPLNFWPGAIVSVSTPVVVDRDEAGSVAVGVFGNPLQIASLCSNDGATSPGGYTTCLASVTSSNNAVPNQTATLLSDGANVGNGMTLTKGRLNFTGAPGGLSPRTTLSRCWTRSRL